jgi:hypothetical protein
MKKNNCIKKKALYNDNGSIPQDDIKILNVHAPSKKASR